MLPHLSTLNVVLLWSTGAVFDDANIVQQKWQSGKSKMRKQLKPGVDCGKLAIL